MLKKIFLSMSMFITTSSISYVCAMENDPYGALADGLDSVERHIQSGKSDIAGQELKALQLEYGSSEAFEIFQVRYNNLKVLTLKQPQPTPIQLPVSHAQPASQEALKQIEHKIINDALTLKIILEYIIPGTLILLDLDDNLFVIPVNDLERRPVRIEQDIETTINDYRSRGAIVLGFSIRSLATAEKTEANLRQVGINFAQGIPVAINEGEFSGLTGTAGYRNGVIYAAGKDNGMKGIATKLFFEKNPQLKINRVIFSDDAITNVEIVHETLKAIKMDSVSIHFTGALEMNRRAVEATGSVRYEFAPRIAEEQEMNRLGIPSVAQYRELVSASTATGMSVEDLWKMQ